MPRTARYECPECGHAVEMPYYGEPTDHGLVCAPCDERMVLEGKDYS